MHEVLVNRLGGLSLPRKSVVRLTDRPDMTLDVYRGRKTTIQQQQLITYQAIKAVFVSFISEQLVYLIMATVSTIIGYILNDILQALRAYMQLLVTQVN